jgi:glycerophosphoryl diester phosphodiesterase
MKKRWIALGILAAFAGGVFLFNASFFAKPEGELTLLAHRGMHQHLVPPVDSQTCSAAIHEPKHAFIENTIPSMRAAFDVGADIVEIDIHPTTDGEFAVFHDWELDCRTDGTGIVRQHSMAELRALDVGYGYSADNGATFPLRGQGVGMMPTLREVLSTFPDRRFLIDFKSNDPNEGDLVAAYLDAFPEAQPQRLIFFGARPAERLHALRPDWKTTGRRRVKACAADYMLTGWFGAIPATCRNTLVGAPVNLGWIAWGWPDRFLERMQSVNTDVLIVGPMEGGRRQGLGAIDDAETFARVPRNWRGGVSTDAIEVIGPLAAAQ